MQKRSWRPEPCARNEGSSRRVEGARATATLQLLSLMRHSTTKLPGASLLSPVKTNRNVPVIASARTGEPSLLQGKHRRWSRSRFASRGHRGYPVMRRGSDDSRSTLIGTRARIVVPRPGSDSITIAPFTSCSLSCVLTSPKPRLPRASRWSNWSNPAHESLTVKWISFGVPHNSTLKPLRSLITQAWWSADGAIVLARTWKYQKTRFRACSRWAWNSANSRACSFDFSSSIANNARR
jgi:hypothetical protein